MLHDTPPVDIEARDEDVLDMLFRAVGRVLRLDRFRARSRILLPGWRLCGAGVGLGLLVVVMAEGSERGLVAQRRRGLGGGGMRIVGGMVVTFTSGAGVFAGREGGEGGFAKGQPAGGPAASGCRGGIGVWAGREDAGHVFLFTAFTQLLFLTLPRLGVGFVMRKAHSIFEGQGLNGCPSMFHPLVPAADDRQLAQETPAAEIAVAPPRQCL